MKVAMLTSIIAVLIALIAPISGKEQGCGGLFQGDNGKFDYFPVAAVDGGKSPENCIWLVQAYGATEIQFTLQAFLPVGINSTVILYPDTAPGETDLNPVTLNAQSIGSTLTLKGSTVVIISTESNSSLSFSWDSTLADNLGRNDSVTMADYIETPQGGLTWTPGRRQEKHWWVIATQASAQAVSVEWETQADLSDCDRNHPCTCLSFDAFELGTDGYLIEVSRTCGRSSSGVFQLESGPLVVATSANTTKRGASRVQLHWMQEQDSSTTTSTTTASPGIEPSIYVATDKSGISAFSLETNQVEKIANSNESLVGITYDSVRSKLYWSTDFKIYRSNKDGSDIETVFNTSEYENIFGLAFDWVSGNVYAATFEGFILVCGDGAGPTFSCFQILDGQSGAYGIALDPTEGLMYWTRGSYGSIHRAGMDGSSPLTLVSGAGNADGLTIDFASRRLYWAEFTGKKIQSSDMDGGDVRTVVQLPSTSGPVGIAVANDRIYWGNAYDFKLQSSTKDGQDIQTLYTDTSHVRLITVVPQLDQSVQRTNDCEGRSCSKLCVLTPASYRCLG